MAFNVQEFRAQFQYGGARKNLFKCLITFPGIVPGGSAAGAKAEFMCKTAQMPGSTINAIDVGYFGRKLKVPGDRTFDELSLTIINDEDYLVRRAFEEWSNGLNAHVLNVRNPAALETNQYQSDLTLVHYDKIGQENKRYKFVGVWPSAIQGEDHGWEDNDSISETQVTMQYQWWQSDTTD